jgi:hypothetical protein
VVVVSSGTHSTDRRRKGPYPNPQWRPARELARPVTRPSGQVAYATSKLANALHVAALAAEGVEAFAYDPLLMPGTGLARDYGPVQKAVWNGVLPRLVRVVPFMSTAERSGAALARLAADPDPGHPAGEYVELARARPADPPADDPTQARALTRDSADLVAQALRPSASGQAA